MTFKQQSDSVKIFFPDGTELKGGVEIELSPEFSIVFKRIEVSNMKIQFDGKAFHVIKDEHLIKSFPLKEWELEYDALGKIQAIDFIKNSTGQTVLDYNEIYEKIRIIK